MEKRLLMAFLLSAVIFMVWSALFPPVKPPVGPEGNVASPTPAAVATETVPVPSPPEEGEPVTAAAGERAGAPLVGGPVEATSEEEIVLENGELHVVLTNRGAAISSLILKGYEDDEGRPLDLVQTLDDPRRALPLQLVGPRGVDRRLYAAERLGRTVTFRWSDGSTEEVTKRITLEDDGYFIGIEVEQRGRPTAGLVAVGTGMRDIGEMEKANRFATWGDVAVLAGGELEKYHRKKIEEPVEIDGSTVVFVGFEDTYFLNLLRPSVQLEKVRIVPLEVVPRPAAGERESGKSDEDGRVLQVLLEPAGDAFSGTLFPAPKEYDLLQKVDRGVEETLHFGIFHPISVVFLKVLRWIHGFVGNWGLAIILLTVLIRVILFPLMHTSTVSMRKMQKLQPKVKAIQEKYRKHKGDPQMRAKMNQEMMELYKVEGVNPMGGCLPMLVQLPILWALYTLFAYAIELRHAPFVFWIHDLSAKDPYYITPVLMTATMWLQQKLAPQAGDPQQQKMFRMMPLIFGIMFLGFPSGLVLYWLTNNVLTIIQQEITLHMIGERKKQAPSPKKRGKAK